MSAIPLAEAPPNGESAAGNPGDTDQVVPFQCRARPSKDDLLICVRPTAHASVALLALTPKSTAVLPGVAGVVTWDQAVPFQLSMSAFAPAVVKAFALWEAT